MSAPSSSLPSISQNNDEDTPIGPGNLTTEAGSASEADSPDHTERHANLHQATAALALAYHRIHRLRQFRRNLLDVPESSSPGDSQNQPLGTVYPTFNSHTMALEPGVEASSSAYSGTALNNEVPSLLPVQTASNSTNTPLFDSFVTSDDSFNSTVLYPRLPRSQLESRFRHRESFTDDASTSLGRRVAAREAAGVSNSSLASRYDGRSAQTLNALEREFDSYVDNYLAVLRERRSGTSTTASDMPFFRRTDLRRQRSLLRTHEDGTSPSNSIAPRADLRRRLTESLFSSRSEAPSSRSERLSLLSNFSSVQNLPTPTVDGSARPLLFEEPSSYLTSDFMNESRSDTTTSLSREPRRSYVVRRRFNADGEEHVHPINLDWDEQPVYTPYTDRQDTQSSLPETQSRRRGWARLDPDGNEIPSEEEEALERTRTEIRLRRQTPLDLPPTDPGYHALPAPTTSTSITPDDTDSRVPRVRLNNSAMQAKADTAATGYRHSTRSSVAPFLPNPLPMPIEDMIWTPPSRRPLRPNRVPRNASFAAPEPTSTERMLDTTTFDSGLDPEATAITVFLRPERAEDIIKNKSLDITALLKKAGIVGKFRLAASFGETMKDWTADEYLVLEACDAQKITRRVALKILGALGADVGLKIVRNGNLCHAFPPSATPGWGLEKAFVKECRRIGQSRKDTEDGGGGDLDSSGGRDGGGDERDGDGGGRGGDGDGHDGGGELGSGGDGNGGRDGGGGGGGELGSGDGNGGDDGGGDGSGKHDGGGDGSGGNGNGGPDDGFLRDWKDGKRRLRFTSEVSYQETRFHTTCDILYSMTSTTPYSPQDKSDPIKGPSVKANLHYLSVQTLAPLRPRPSSSQELELGVETLEISMPLQGSLKLEPWMPIAGWGACEDPTNSMPNELDWKSRFTTEGTTTHSTSAGVGVTVGTQDAFNSKFKKSKSESARQSREYTANPPPYVYRVSEIMAEPTLDISGANTTEMRARTGFHWRAYPFGIEMAPKPSNIDTHWEGFLLGNRASKDHGDACDGDDSSKDFRGPWAVWLPSRLPIDGTCTLQTKCGTLWALKGQRAKKKIIYPIIQINLFSVTLKRLQVPVADEQEVIRVWYQTIPLSSSTQPPQCSKGAPEFQLKTTVPVPPPQVSIPKEEHVTNLAKLLPSERSQTQNHSLSVKEVISYPQDGSGVSQFQGLVVEIPQTQGLFKQVLQNTVSKFARRLGD
ncbi:hypothetical protein H0H92_007453 [Tricholoma furcatifolium]|nr:hypothetical protein H0H92_007453 [Tricholoma furcatifolium]